MYVCMYVYEYIYNYRPISILANISELPERCRQSLLSKFHYGFRQGFTAQHCLLMMVQNMRKFRDSKSFGCSSH